MKRKRTLSLLEMMIVILLITLITGVIGYNMRGSLEKGKIFKSRQAKEQLHNLLLLALEENANKGEEIADKPGIYLKDLRLSRDPDKLLVDGWGGKFTVKFNKKDKDFVITSENDDLFKEPQKNSDAR